MPQHSDLRRPVFRRVRRRAAGLARRRLLPVTAVVLAAAVLGRVTGVIGGAVTTAQAQAVEMAAMGSSGAALTTTADAGAMATELNDLLVELEPR